jgi:hypothetical protein
MSLGRIGGAEVVFLAPEEEVLGVLGGLPWGVMGLPLLKKTREAAETGLSPFLLRRGVSVGSGYSEEACRADGIEVGWKEREYCWEVVFAAVQMELFVWQVRSLSGNWRT